jgi:solute carrier family 15 oligopeptide transporter 1
VAFGVSGILELFIQSNPVGSIHMFWQIPQIFLITVAEILLSITGLEFAYKQAPSSMKSLIQAFWLLTVAGGNLLNVLQALIVTIEDRALAIILFAGVTVVSATIFTFLAWKFVPRKDKVEDVEEDE